MSIYSFISTPFSRFSLKGSLEELVYDASTLADIGSIAWIGTGSLFSNKGLSIRKKRRDASVIANSNVELPVLPMPETENDDQIGRSDYLPDVEDGRTFHTEGVYRDARTISGKKVRVRQIDVTPKGKGYSLIYQYYPNAQRVLICLKRAKRREIMFATGNAGRIGQKRPKFNVNSDIHCVWGNVT